MSVSPQVCKSCGTVNKAKSKFCKKCGASLQILQACPQCGSKLDPDSVFCQQCGFKVATQVEAKREVSLRPMTIRRLPLGLEILIVFGGLGAALYFFSAIMVLAAAPILPIPELRLVGALWLLVALFLAAVSWGLWNLKEWARKALIVNCVLVIIGVSFDIVAGLLGLVYCIIILWYISRPHIKALFEVGRVSATEILTPSISPVGRVCPSCGKRGKPSAKFCVKCGTELK